MSFFAINAMAAFGRQDVRLEMRTEPKASFTSTINTSVFRVLGDGSVYRAEFNSKGAMVSRKSFASVSTDQIDRINTLIEAARTGKIETEVHQIHCMAISGTFTIFSADNSSVLLEKSTLCQDPTLNTAPEAAELIKIVQKLAAEDSELLASK